jgi:hypothetical protein
MCGPLVYDEIYSSGHNLSVYFSLCNYNSLDYCPHVRSCLVPSFSCTNLLHDLYIITLAYQFFTLFNCADL